MIAKLVSTKSRWSNYNAQEMLFNNEQHFDAWLESSMSKGLKVVGHIDLALEITCNIDPSDEQFLRIAQLESLKEALWRVTADSVKIGRSDRGNWIQYRVTEHESNFIMVRKNLLTKWSNVRKRMPIYNFIEIEKYINKTN